MKQRLLLSLLMLFVSVGLVKADNEPISIVVKAGEKATITFQNEGKGFVAPDKEGKSYPVIEGQTPTVKDASTAVYTVTAGKDADLTLSVSTDYPTDVNKWKSVAITVDGKVKEFTIHKDQTTAIAKGTSPLLSHITSITFTNNGETLEALKLGTHSWKTDYLPKLGALTVPDSKLARIPAKTDEDGKEKITHYSIGKVAFTQTSAYVPSNADSKTARSYLIKPSELFNSDPYDDYLKDAVEQNGFKLTSVKDESGNAVYAELDEAKPVYRFYNNATDKVYWDGTFTADVEIIKGIYEGITLTGVQFEVAPAQFTLTIKGMNETKVKVEVTTNGNPFDLNTETMVKNQKFTLTPTSVAGSTFSSFEVVSGAIIKGHEGDSYNFETDGKSDVVIKVNAGVAANKIIFEQDPSGTLEVLSDGGRLTSGVAIETGAKLTIKAEAKTGFEIDKVLINDEEVEGDLTNENRSFVGEAKVPAVEKGENVVVKVVYKAKTYLFEVDRPAAGTSNDITSFKVFNKNNTTDEPFIVNGGNKSAYFAAGTELRVEITMKDATTKVAAQINGEKQTFRTDSKENVYVFDYTMPTRNSKLVVTVDDLTEVKVALVEDELAYNGLNQQVAYTTTPQNMQDIIVTYANSDDKDAEWGATAYKEFGTHYVRFYRKADTHYQELDVIKEYKITGAQLVVTELPKVDVSADKTEWVITGGEIGYLQGEGNISLSAEEMAKLGKFSVKTAFDKDATSASVEFTLNNANDKTYTVPAAATVPVGDAETIKVEVNSKSDTEYGSLRLMNGGAEIHNGDMLPDGTGIKLDVPNKDTEVTYEVYRVDGNAETILKEGWSYIINMKDGGAEKGRELLSFRLKVTDERIQPVLDEHNSKLEQKVVYNGDAQTFDVNELKWKENKENGTDITSGVLYTADSWWTITYRQEDGTIVPEPINAGKYKVTLERKGGATYQPIEPFEATLEVLQAEFDQSKVNKGIKATAIGAGSPLSDSELSGMPSIAGHYEWAVNIASINEAGEYAVKFIPDDPNYAPATLKNVTVKVEVTDEYTLTYSNPDGLGMIEVRDAYGIVPSGSTLKAGTQLYLTAKPKDATKVRLVDITGVTGISYTDAGVTNAPFPFNGKMDIRAYFEVIEQEVIDPDSRYIVSVTASGRGFVVETGEFGVPRGGSYNFAVEALAEDMSKIVVKTSRGETLKPKDGFYSVEEVDENISVSVSLPNPTELEVEIPEEYKNKGGYVVGTVRVESDYLDDKYYYGDVITVIAFPESGVKFDKWSDGSKAQMHEITLYKDTKLDAVFTGTPTGIEDIETAKVYTGKGFIQINNVANAEVTVVSISGRLQAKQEISGDTQIAVPQGIYVVVLQSGDDMKQLKVIVK